MKYQKIHTEIAKAIEEILEDNKETVSKSILLFADTDGKILESLYDLLTNTGKSEKLSFPENNHLNSWAKDSDVAVCLITDDLIDSKYNCSQGFAVKIRDLSRQTDKTLLYIATPNMLNLDSLATAGLMISKSFLSRREILMNQIDKLHDKPMSSYLDFLKNYLESKSDNFVYKNFSDLFNFIQKILSADSEVDFAKKLHLIGLIRDDELSFTKFSVNTHEYLEINMKISRNIKEAIQSGDSVFYILEDYCDPSKAQEVDSWIRHQSTSEINEIFRNWPEELLLSKIVSKLEKPSEVAQKFSFLNIELDKTKHSSSECIFSTSLQSIFNVTEDSLSLKFTISRYLSGQEQLLFTINESSTKQTLPVPKNETDFTFSIKKKNWHDGLNYITFSYKPTARSKVREPINYYFIYNSGLRNWEVYEINGNLEKNNFYIDDNVNDSLILAIIGETSDSFNVLKEAYEDESPEDLEVSFKFITERKQIVISTDELEDEGTLQIKYKNESVYLNYKIYRDKDYAERSESIYDILFESQFNKESSQIQLGDIFNVNIDSLDFMKFGEPLIDYISYVNKSLTLKNQKTNETYVIEYSSDLFELEKWILSEKEMNPFPSCKRIEQLNFIPNSEIELDLINHSWAADRINTIKEMTEFESFINCRKTLFKKIEDRIKTLNLPIFTINLIPYENIIYEYAFTYLSLLSSEKNIYQKEEKVFDYRSILLFFDFIFIQNKENDPYIGLMTPLHPLMLLNLLLKQKQFYSWFETDNKISKISRYDVDKIKRSSIPLLLNLGQNTEADTLLDTTYLKLTSKYDSWGIYISLAEKRKGYEQNQRIEGESIINEILDFSSLEQGLDLTKIIHDKIENYLVSHPYLLQKNTTISINFINPSRGQHLLDALLKLNRKKRYRDLELKYNISLFSREDVPSYELGRSFVEFFSKPNPNDFEAQMMSSISYVISNVSPDKRSELSETIKVIENLPYSHLTFISGIFHDSIRVSTPKANRFSSTQSSIFSYYDTKFDPSDSRFYRGMFTYPTNNIQAIPNSDSDFTVIYNQLLHTMTCFSASIHQTYDENNLLSLMLQIEPKMKDIITSLHQNTDWACFIDQDLGVELFDRALNDQVEYLIDFSPPFESQINHSNVIVTTEQIDYILAIMKNQLKLLCQHEIHKEKTMNMLLSSLNYLAGSWALSALKDEYPNLTGKLGEVLALFELLKGNQNQPLVKIENGDIKSIRIVISNYHYIEAWKNDDSEKFSKLSDDLLEIVIERDGQDLEKINITMIPIEAKHGESASKRDVISGAKEQIESAYLILKHRFHRFGDYNSSLRDLELAQLLEKNVRRFFRYFETDKALIVHEFLIDVIEKIQRQNYETFFGYKTENKLLYGKVFGFDPYVSAEDIDPELELDGIFLFGLEKIAVLLDIVDEIEVIEKEALEAVTETPIITSQESFTALEVIEDETLEDVMEIKPIEVEEPVTKLKDELEEVTAEISIAPVLDPEIMLGTTGDSVAEEWGIIGEYQNKKVAVNMNEPLTTVILGAKGSGKSYTTGVIIEAAQNLPPGLNNIHSKLQTIIFHFHQDTSYAPEYLSLIDKNDNEDELNALLLKYNQHAVPLEKIKVFVTPRSYEEQKKIYENESKIDVFPLFFHPEDLGIDGWRLLLFADSNDSLYIQVIHEFLNELYYGESELTPTNLLKLVEEDDELSLNQKKLAKRRINLARRYISKENHAFKYINKGDTVIVDVREKLMDKNTAMSLFLIFARVASERGEGNKLIVFDEAHKYFSTSMKEEIVTLNREVRHRGVSLVVSSQDPKSIADTIIELSEIVIIHKTVVPDWLKILKKKLSSMEDVDIKELSNLEKGEALIWAKEANRLDFTMGMKKIKIRPRSTTHGGRSVKNV